MYLFYKLDITSSSQVGEYWSGKIKEEITIEKLLNNPLTLKNNNACIYLREQLLYNIDNIYPIEISNMTDIYVSSYNTNYNQIEFKIMVIFFYIKFVDLLTPTLIIQNNFLKGIIHRDFLIRNNRNNSDKHWFDYQISYFCDNIAQQKIYDLRYISHPLLKTKLYDYQKDSIQRMINLELNPIKIKLSNDKIIKLSNGIIYNYTANKFIKEDDINDYLIKGGVLTDDVGVGKTIQILCLCLTRPEIKTLILVPDHLYTQWLKEINKHFNVINLDNINIMSFTSWFSEPKTNFDRLVIDESHELTIDSCLKKWNALINFKAQYKWLVTATPFINNTSIFNIIQFITSTQFYDEKIGHNIDIYPVLEKVFIRKLKKNLSELDLPEINIIDNFIKFTNIEKNILDAELAASKEFLNIKHLRQLCVDAQLNLEVFNNRQLTLNELKNLYMKKYEDNYNVENNRLEELNRNKELVLKEINNNNKLELLFNLEHINTNILAQEKLVKSSKDVYERYKNNISIIEKSVNQDNQDNQECSICLNNFEDIIAYYSICGHFYCKTCSDIILDNKKYIKCPTCRIVNNIEDIKLISNTEVTTISSKFAEIIKTVNKIDDKVIVFTQFNKVIDKLKYIFEKYYIKAITYKDYNNYSDIYKVLILSSIDNASGLDLSNINNIIIVEPFEDYIYGKEIEKQIIGRVHRINQVNKISVYRMIVKDTIEEEIYTRQF